MHLANTTNLSPCVSLFSNIIETDNKEVKKMLMFYEPSTEENRKQSLHGPKARSFPYRVELIFITSTHLTKQVF